LFLRKKQLNNQTGFTLVELLVVIVVTGIIIVPIITFIITSLNQYAALQTNAATFGDLAQQSERMASVLRGATDFISESANDVTLYAYFQPNDTYVSIIHYYKNLAGTQLLADVTPMTANPPTGSPITANLKTYVIINSLYVTSGVNTFVYLDSSGAVMTIPIVDEHAINGMKVNLAVPSQAPIKNSSEAITLSITLRNRKTNL